MSKVYICDNRHGCDESELGCDKERGDGYPLSCCPECGSTDLQDATLCGECGNYYADDEQHECK